MHFITSRPMRFHQLPAQLVHSLHTALADTVCSAGPGSGFISPSTSPSGTPRVASFLSTDTTGRAGDQVRHEPQKSVA